MTTLNNAVYLLAYITIQAGELSYPMRRVTANIHGDVNTALNDLNSELKDEFLGVEWKRKRKILLAKLKEKLFSLRIFRKTPCVDVMIGFIADT